MLCARHCVERAKPTLNVDMQRLLNAIPVS
jgi:hypothetical protein